VLLPCFLFTAAAGFASKTRYLFGRFSIQMKVHPGDSAGTVSTFYVRSLTQNEFICVAQWVTEVLASEYALSRILSTCICLNLKGPGANAAL